MKFDSSFRSLMAAALAIGSCGAADAMAGCPCRKGGHVAPDSVSTPIPDWNATGVTGMPYSNEMSSHPMSGDPGLPYGGVTGNPVPGVAPNAAWNNRIVDGTEVPATGVPGVGPGYSSATATSWQPPPGTIGRTYQMKSRPVPVTMHPRSAIVDVRAPNAVSVRVHDMNVSRTEDYLDGFHDHKDSKMWHFTADPLIPGLPHIYRIEARYEGPDGKETVQERYVRLIMGRVIEVEF